MTRFLPSLWATVGLGLLWSSLTVGAEPKKILVVTVTTEFRHSSIPTAERILTKLGKDSGLFQVDFVQQPPNEPILNKPAEPKRPEEPKPDSDEAKYQKALEQYKTDLQKYLTSLEKYHADLEKYQAEEPKLKAARPVWEAQQKAALGQLRPANLLRYSAVLFINTTGDLPLPDRDGFIQWIREGHGFVATHSGSDTFHHYRPYLEMLGGEFETHHAQVAVDCLNLDPQHPACRHLDPVWNIFDEIYIIKSYSRASVHGLLTLNHHPNEKDKAGDYPISWCKEFGRGKVFYTSLGHREDVWENPIYQIHLLGGIKWALGLAPGDAAPQTAAR
jgi:type 1 glutamine amidotransferase